MKKDNYKALHLPSLSNVVSKQFTNLNAFSIKRKCRVLIFGFFGMNNIGDDAILLTEINELRKLNIPLEIIVPSQNPSIVESTNDVTSISTGNVIETFKAVVSSDLIIFGGGGLICKSKSDLTFKQNMFDNLFSIYKCLMYFILPRLANKKIIVFGIGAYPNINILQKICYMFSLNFVDFISVRDKVSYNFLKSITTMPIHYQKDVAFLLDQQKFDKNEADILDKIISSKKRVIGISLINTGIPTLNELILKSVASVVNNYSKHFSFYFFPFYTEPHTANDLEMAHQLSKYLAENTSYEIIDSSIGAKGFFYLYSKLDGALSMRFHAQVFSYKNNVPFIGISYDEKCKSFLEEIKVDYVETKYFNSIKFIRFFDDYLNSMRNTSKNSMPVFS